METAQRQGATRGQRRKDAFRRRCQRLTDLSLHPKTDSSASGAVSCRVRSALGKEKGRLKTQSSHDGYEWPGPVFPDHAINLEGLSPAHLRQLIQPRNLATGKPGIPLASLADKSPKGLGGYLCSRGVGSC